MRVPSLCLLCLGLTLSGCPRAPASPPPQPAKAPVSGQPAKALTAKPETEGSRVRSPRMAVPPRGTSRAPVVYSLVFREFPGELTDLRNMLRQVRGNERLEQGETRYDPTTEVREFTLLLTSRRAPELIRRDVATLLQRAFVVKLDEASSGTTLRFVPRE